MGLLNRLSAVGRAWFGRVQDQRHVEAVAWAIEILEPRLRHLPGYPRRYIPAVASALAHCEELAGQMRPPLPVDRAAFAQNPTTRVLFATTEDIPQVLGQSQAVRDWLRGREAEEFVALMGVRLREKDVFGPVLEAGEVRRDVAQRVLVFSDHTFTALADDEKLARDLLAREFFNSLVTQVKSSITALREERDRLAKACHLARISSQQAVAAPEALEDCTKSLQEVSAALELSRYGDHLDAVLLDPARHIGLRPLVVAVDEMGVCRVDGGAGAAREVPLCELSGRDRRRWMVTLVRGRSADLAARPDFSERLAEAGRWLTI